MKIVRFRVRHGYLEPLEPLDLVEGSEVEMNVPIPETAAAEPAARPAIKFRTWKMGVREPLTREEIYEDVG